MQISYGRVSTRDQNPDAQHDGLDHAGCDEVFVEEASGKLASRPKLDEVLRTSRAGDYRSARMGAASTPCSRSLSSSASHVPPSTATSSGQPPEQ